MNREEDKGRVILGNFCPKVYNLLIISQAIYPSRLEVTEACDIACPWANRRRERLEAQVGTALRSTEEVCSLIKAISGAKSSLPLKYRLFSSRIINLPQSFSCICGSRETDHLCDPRGISETWRWEPTSLSHWSDDEAITVGEKVRKWSRGSRLYFSLKYYRTKGLNSEAGVGDLQDGHNFSCK